MPLHDEVEVSCKRGATTENQFKVQVPFIWTKGVCWMIVWAKSDLT